MSTRDVVWASAPVAECG